MIIVLDTQLEKDKRNIVYNTKVIRDPLLFKYAIVVICTKGTYINISFTQTYISLRTC